MSLDHCILHLHSQAAKQVSLALVTFNWMMFPVCGPHSFLTHLDAGAQLISIIVSRSFLQEPDCYLPYYVKSSRSVWEKETSHSLTVCDEACFLPWRHLRQFMSGSLRGGASQIEQTSSTPAATEAKAGKQRGSREKKMSVRNKRQRVEQGELNALIDVYWFKLLAHHWFQCLLLPLPSFNWHTFSPVLIGFQKILKFAICYSYL